MPSLRMIRRMLFDGRGTPPPPAARPNPRHWADDRITGSCLGHSTVLINLLGMWVLTDPVFSLRVGPGVPPFILGPKRYLQPALAPREFPAPDLILLSHAHFDHCDVWSLRRFERSTPIVTARATGDILRCRGFRDVHELDWGQSFDLRARDRELRVSAIEVKHWGARMIRDEHRGYNGYLIERAGRRVCFGGDTAYTPAFSRLRDPARPIDLMLMPVGAYDPWIANHCSPEQAVEMSLMAGARHFVPVHHETFKLSQEPMHEPAARVRRAFAREPERLLAVDVGETFCVPEAPSRGEPSIAA